MQQRKFKLKLNRSELNTLYDLFAVMLQMNPGDYHRKMLWAGLASIYIKMMPKWVMAGDKIVISLTALEALCFYNFFKHEDFSNTHLNNSINTICNDIHKQYI